MGSLYLVDDHLMIRDAMRTVLSSRGYAVLGEADNPTAALAEIVRLRPDVVLLDLNLGTRSGFELLEEIQQRRLSSRVIVLTMAEHMRHVAEAVKLGAFSYVLKGEPLDGLLKAIEKVLKGQRHFEGDVAQLVAQALSSPDSSDRVNALSARERQVVMMVVRGHSSTEIGAVLHLSPKTVDSYRSRLMSKLGVSDVTALVRFAIRAGLIDVDEA